MRLERVGAGLIVLAIIVWKVAFWGAACPPHSWCNTYLPFGGFLVLIIGALLGVAGMISARLEERRKRRGNNPAAQ
jgi:hypothetical protein